MGVQYYTSDSGGAITAEVITNKNFLTTIGDPEDLKRLDTLYFFATPRSTLKVFISYDGGDWDYLGTIKEYPQRFDLGGKKCYYIELKFTESSSNMPFIAEAYVVRGDKIPEQR